MSYLDKCRPSFKSRSYGKIDTDSVAWFTKIRDPQQCNIFGFRHSETTDGVGQFSKQYSDRPDEIICGLEKCDMTGTLFVTPDTPQPSGAVTTKTVAEIDKNGEPFQFGYARLLMYGKKGDSFDLTLRMKGTQNGNKYNVVLKDDGWNAVVIELFNPDELLGTGWIGEPIGFFLDVEPKQVNEFRVSTFELFESAYDLVKDMTIGFTCVTDFSGDPALTITDDICTIPSYDDTATTIERSITANNIIGEPADFGGIYKRTNKYEFTVKRNGRFKANEKVLNGVTYAAIEIPDLAPIKCPHLVVQPQNCELPILYHMQVDNTINKVNIPEDMYFIEDETVYMKDVYADADFIVAYPRIENGTGWEITTKELNQAKYYMEMITPIGKDEYVLKADNVLVTGLPLTWTREAGTMTIPYSMVKGIDGVFGTFVKLDNSK